MSLASEDMQMLSETTPVKSSATNIMSPDHPISSTHNPFAIPKPFGAPAIPRRTVPTQK